MTARRTDASASLRRRFRWTGPRSIARAGLVTAAVAGLLVVARGSAPDAAPASTAGAKPILQTRSIAADGRRAVSSPDGVDVPTGMPTEMAGFQWSGRVEASVEVRGLGAQGWTAWTAASTNLDEGPDRSSPEWHDRTTAGPVWLGETVTRLQVRVRGPSPADFKISAIRSEHAAASAGAGTASATELQPAAASMPLTTPAAISTKAPHIISRSEWGADESMRTCTPDIADGVHFAVVHHTDSTNNYTATQSYDIVRGIYAFHVQTNGWCDIGYNFLVDKYGQIFEGRYGGITRAVIGAHAGGFNTNSTGVAMLGTFTTTAVPATLYNGLRSLLAWKLAYHGIDPNGSYTTIAGDFPGSKYPAGTEVTLKAIIGHRDVGQTDCPGDQGYSILPRLRSDLAAILGAQQMPELTRTSYRWYRQATQTDYSPLTSFKFGVEGDQDLSCDWKGDGKKYPVVYRNGTWFFAGTQTGTSIGLQFNYGLKGDTAVCGDWNGDGKDTIGVVREVGDGELWLIRNTNSVGDPSYQIGYGLVGDQVVVGDWNGDGRDSFGVYRGTTFLLRDSLTDGDPNRVFGFGVKNDVPVAGDWNGDGVTTVGVYRGAVGTWYLRNSSDGSSSVDTTFRFGVDGDVPLAWR